MPISSTRSWNLTINPADAQKFALMSMIQAFAKSLESDPFDEPMIGALKGARNIVIHSGKEPTDSGQRDIMKYLKELHRAVSQ